MNPNIFLFFFGSPIKLMSRAVSEEKTKCTHYSSSPSPLLSSFSSSPPLLCSPFISESAGSERSTVADFSTWSLKKSRGRQTDRKTAISKGQDQRKGYACCHKIIVVGKYTTLSIPVSYLVLIERRSAFLEFAYGNLPFIVCQ